MADDDDRRTNRLLNTARGNKVQGYVKLASKLGAICTMGEHREAHVMNPNLGMVRRVIFSSQPVARIATNPFLCSLCGIYS